MKILFSYFFFISMLCAALIPSALVCSEIVVDGLEFCENEEKGESLEIDFDDKILQLRRYVYVEKYLLKFYTEEFTLHLWNKHIPHIHTPPPEFS